MIKTSSGRVLKSNSKILQSKNGVSFLVDTNIFPQNLGSGWDSASLRLTFRNAVPIEVDWGDGVYEHLTATAFVSGSYKIGWFDQSIGGNTPIAGDLPAHTYPDATVRTIKFYYPVGDLVSFEMNNTHIPLQDFAFGFALHRSMTYFALGNLFKSPSGYSINNLDLKNMSYLNNFTSLNLTSVFNGNIAPVSPYYGEIPLEMIRDLPNLQILGVGDSTFNGKTFAQTNVDKIATYQGDTLTKLTLPIGFTDTNADVSDSGALPANFVNFTKLTYCNFYGNNWTQIPPILNSMCPLQTLILTYGNFTSWGDLSGQPSLVTLELDAVTTLPVTVPSWFSAMVHLKTLNMRSCFQGTSGNIDAFITNLYTFVVATANMNGTGKWTGVTFNIAHLSGLTAASPSGTYQPPAGYSSSSNGAPASSRERIYVLNTRYRWNCIFEP